MGWRNSNVNSNSSWSKNGVGGNKNNNGMNKDLQQMKAEFKAQQAVQTQLWGKQEKLNRFSTGFILHEDAIGSFEQQLTAQQRGAVLKVVQERYQDWSISMTQAEHPFDKGERVELLHKLVQHVLYEQYVPVYEIYHFGSEFLNGYTPQKMQAVRGYFDGVFAGTYPKAIPEGKRGAIECNIDIQEKLSQPFR
jgi:hypothetical protein